VMCVLKLAMEETRGWGLGTRDWGGVL
jgi:hypothetical protein